MHLTDSHCHLDDYEDLPAVLARAREAGVGTLLAIGIGDGPATMGRALALAQENEGVWASVGIHPQEAASATDQALERLEKLAGEPKCVAVGEIGLDYYHADNPSVEVQQAAFLAQMRIAAAVGKPILIHCRTSELAKPEAKEKFGEADAWEDLLRLIGWNWGVERGGIMHCFSGTVEQARRSLSAGFHLSFAGNVTYPKSVEIREAAAIARADRILIETDAPFLAPIPHRGQRNEPALMVHTARAVAALRGVTVEQLAEQTTANFRWLFRIDTLSY